MTKIENVSLTKISYFQSVGSCYLNIRYSDLPAPCNAQPISLGFRVSDFDIRIFAESRQGVISVQTLNSNKGSSMQWFL